MSIRSTVKALLVENGRLLLNQCRTADGQTYYDLPGGGQHLYETMEEAVAREVLEETGIPVEVELFAGLVEEITTDPALRGEYPEYRTGYSISSGYAGPEKPLAAAARKTWGRRVRSG